MIDDVQQHIALVSENWFLSEPVYYAVYCTLQKRENSAMPCPVRTGKGLLEYNPLLLAHTNYRDTELLLRTEMIRLLLLHPYSRRPVGVRDEIIATGSDITIGDNYCFIRGKEKLPVQSPEAYHLPLGMPYEWYVEQLRRKGDDPQSDQQDLPAQQGAKAQLWEEREMERERIRQLIDRTIDWGSIPASLVEKIRLGAQLRVNHHHLLQGFRASVLAEQCQLTRMRPSRRMGYEQMGCRRIPVTRLLMAVDVSGSVESREIGRAFRLIDQVFRYSGARIDVLCFDAMVQRVFAYRRTLPEIVVTGRGGTDYQVVMDYLEAHSEYNGLVLLTDGQAPLPQPVSLPVLWVLPSLAAYHQQSQRLAPLGRVTYLD